MTRKHVSLAPAYVLHRRAYRDSSLLLELFCREHGRFSVVARGAKRPKARSGNLLQLFWPLLASWSRRGELGTLTAVEPAAGARPLYGRMLISGLYVNELIMRLLHRDDAHPRLFDAYETVLSRLAGLGGGQAQAAQDEQRVLRLFEKTLVQEIGYGLVLDHDVASGQPLMDGASYVYVPERGPIAIPEAVPGAASTAATAGLVSGAGGRKGVVVRGESLTAFAAEDLRDRHTLADIKQLMRMVLTDCLDGRPLHSRRLYQQYKMQAGTVAIHDPVATIN